MTSIKKIILFAGKTEVFFIALLWLMIILVAGTVAQKDIGLYMAQEKYFSSFFFYIKEVPLPAGYSVMTIISLSLTIKLFTNSWKIKNIGTLVTHIGALMLLFGGFLTAVSSSEGNMVIQEGKIAAYIEDYHKKELAIINTSQKNTDTVTVFPQWLLSSNKNLDHVTVPFTIKILSYYRNSRAIIKNNIKTLIKLPLEKVDEQNIAGIKIKIDSEIYTVHELDTIPLAINGYVITLRNKRTYTPFTVKLIDFKKETHPGVSMAKSYSSEIVLQDKGINWHSIVSMNAPLRYKGYTFFQSSFFQQQGKETTVLAVVQNLGRVFPYIASIIMSIGLLIHLFQKLPILFRRKK